MKYLDWRDINSLAVGNTNRPAVFIDSSAHATVEVWEHISSKYIEYFPNNTTDLYGVLHGGLFLFDSNEEAELLYSIFDDKICADTVYSALYDTSGNLIKEN